MPEECPHCGSAELREFARSWFMCLSCASRWHAEMTPQDFRTYLLLLIQHTETKLDADERIESISLGPVSYALLTAACGIPDLQYFNGFPVYQQVLNVDPNHAQVRVTDRPVGSVVTFDIPLQAIGEIVFNEALRLVGAQDGIVYRVLGVHLDARTVRLVREGGPEESMVVHTFEEVSENFRCFETAAEFVKLPSPPTPSTRTIYDALLGDDD